jgi:DNA-binding NtrC family response regulator
VLLWGPRGTGKDLLAHLIHKWSNRSEKPFVSVNFGAISKDLAVAELFGAKKGSYTGCVADRRGYVQEAKGGTLFLDELDEATSSVQALVKRAVQFGLFSIVGDSTESQCDARFVAATNISDLDAVAIKRDLKDRFIVLRVPALCERRGDIRPLAIKFAAEYGYVLPEPVLLFLERLDWPGNVRQLENVVERSCAVAQSEADLTIDLFQSSAAEEGAITKSAEMTDSGVVPLRTGETLEMRLEAEEKRYVIYALTVCEGNRTHAADLLGMSRQWLLGRIKKYDL